MRAADVLDQLERSAYATVPITGEGKFHLVQDDVASVLVDFDGEWWLVSARRSNEEGGGA